MTGFGTSATSLGEPGMSASRGEAVVSQNRLRSEFDRYCRKRVSRQTAEQYRFKIKRKYVILIQKTECPDSIISKFNSTVLFRILSRQYRPIRDIAFYRMFVGGFLL